MDASRKPRHAAQPLPKYHGFIRVVLLFLLTSSPTMAQQAKKSLQNFPAYSLRNALTFPPIPQVSLRPDFVLPSSSFAPRITFVNDDEGEPKVSKRTILNAAMFGSVTGAFMAFLISYSINQSCARGQSGILCGPDGKPVLLATTAGSLIGTAMPLLRYKEHIRKESSLKRVLLASLVGAIAEYVVLHNRRDFAVMLAVPLPAVAVGVSFEL